MVEDLLIARISKNKNQHVRISLGEFKGRQHFSIRIWYDADGEEKPTGKGVNFKLDQFDELIEALTKAKGEAQRIGWLGKPESEAA